MAPKLREVAAVHQTRMAPLPGGLRLARLTAGCRREALDPFLSADLIEYGGQPPAPHPHAGHGIVCYVPPDSPGALRHRNSLGADWLVAPGGLVWSDVGAGMVHQDSAASPDAAATCLQIFIDRPQAARSQAPRAVCVRPQQVATGSANGLQVRWLAGVLPQGLPVARPGGHSALVFDGTDAALLDLELEAGAELRFSPRRDDVAVLHVRRGAVELQQGTQLAQLFTAVLAPGDGEIRLHADPHGVPGAVITLCLGRPLQQGTVAYGPFVASNRQQAESARRRYLRGEMGTLSDEGSLS